MADSGRSVTGRLRREVGAVTNPASPPKTAAGAKRSATRTVAAQEQPGTKVTKAVKATKTTKAAKPDPAKTTRGTTRKAAATKRAAAKNPAKESVQESVQDSRQESVQEPMPAKQPATKKTAVPRARRKKPQAKATTPQPVPAEAPAGAPAGASPAPVPLAEPHPQARPASPESLAVGAGESPWTKEEVDELRALLGEEIVRFESEIDVAEEEIADLISDSGEGAGDDQADAGSKAFEREHEMSLANNAREMRGQSLRALERIDSGAYGVCESCGNPIGKARLQAFPRATLCMRCKQREERR
jgi:RNA polymerase-binding transcription factor DksA